jgi:hypothetical protein
VVVRGVEWELVCHTAAARRVFKKYAAFRLIMEGDRYRGRE